MGNEQSGGVADLWQTLQQVSEWVRFADTKAAAILALDGIIATILVTKFTNESFSQLNLIIPIALAVTALSLIVSAFACMSCILPRLNIGGADNLIYFTGIARFESGPRFLEAVQAASNGGAYEIELATEIWSRSLSASRKYYFIKLAILAMASALSGAALIGLLLVVT